MITVQCNHCQKTFAFDPNAVVKNPVEHMAEDARNVQLVEYRASCPHCGKRNTYLRREKA